jgi:hypothetical protein
MQASAFVKHACAKAPTIHTSAIVIAEDRSASNADVAE